MEEKEASNCQVSILQFPFTFIRAAPVVLDDSDNTNGGHKTQSSKNGRGSEEEEVQEIDNLEPAEKAAKKVTKRKRSEEESASNKKGRVSVTKHNIESIIGVKEEDPVMWAVKLTNGREATLTGESLVRVAPQMFREFVEVLMKKQ